MPSEANARLLSGFLDYLQIEKGLARNSVAAYATDITQFAEFLEKRKRQLFTARRNDVREFLQQLFSNQVDGRSVAESSQLCGIFTDIYYSIRESKAIPR